MIPKRIYWCWFGKGELSQLNKRCIASWSKFCPDYEIIKIDETNFDVNHNTMCSKAYQERNFAIVSDFARFKYLQNGGFYLDTDIELEQSLDIFLDKRALVFSTIGFGIYSSAPLGCSIDGYKLLYDDVILETIRQNSMITPVLNQLVYARYNLLGEKHTYIAGIDFYDESYFAGPRTPANENRIGIHWEENTWIDKWTPIGQANNKFHVPFNIFNIYHNGKICKEETIKVFGKIDPMGKVLELAEGYQVNLELLNYSNLFYNDNVVEVSGTGFKFSKATLNNNCFGIYPRKGIYVKYTQKV